MSDVTYPSISGTSVSRDFVELPSQLYEHWLMVPEVLQRFAIHHETGKPMPAKLAQRIKKARNFNQGFSTVEYVASALVDMELHALPEVEGLDVDTFERATLKRLGMPREIVMRHRIPHFLHIMGGYAAGYYSYLWSEVMDADAFAGLRGGGRRVRSGDGEAAEEVHLFGRQSARSACKPTSPSAAARPRSRACSRSAGSTAEGLRAQSCAATARVSQIS